MSSSDVWDDETAASYDEEAAGKFAPEVLEPTVDVLERLADGGPVLEFAVGTGRVAIPLARRGLSVTGVDLSAPMVAQLRAKVSEEQLPAVVGDMATITTPGAGDFSLVYVVWNSIGNVRTQTEQVACFRNAARHLRPGGRFVIELWVPPLQRLVPGNAAVPMVLEDDYLLLDTYDLVTQQGTSHHHQRESDGTWGYATSRFRYIWPSECDLMAQLAGMELVSRWADWDGSAFTAASDSHVSVWQKQ